MIATSHEEISGMSDVMDEPIVRVAHHGHVDPPIQEKIQGVQTGDLTHTDQLEEIESQLLETPLVEQIVEVDRLMEHLLPGSICIDEDALFSSQDDHSTCLDTSLWDPGAEDSSRLSAQEDTTAHTGYSVSQGEMASSDEMQWHTGVPSSTVDSGQFSTSSYAEGVFGDSRVGTSRTDYQQLLTDRDYLLRVGEMYHEALREQELEMDRLSQELESTRGLLRGTQTALQESESRTYESPEEIHQRSTSSVLVDTQMYQSVTLTEDVDDLAEEHQLMGDTSIGVLGVVDLHIEIDPAVCPGSVMQHEFAGDDRSMPEHTVMRDSSQRHVEMYGGIQRGVLPGREETHLGEHAGATPLQQHMILRPHLHYFSSCLGEGRWRVVYQQLEELLPIVPDDWGLVMTTGKKLSWIPMDELLVESLGLTKACDAFQSYSQLLMFLLACPSTFIIDNSMRRDRLWLRAWRVSRLRLHDRGTFTAYNRSEVDCVRQTIETWYVTVSLIDQVMTDEHRGLQTVISPAQEQPAETGSDKLPTLPWDPGVHLASRMSDYMVTQGAPQSHTLHLGFVWSGFAGTCPMGRDLFFRLAIMIGHGEVWIGTSSTEMPIQIQFLDSRSNGHRYFSWRTQERRVQDVCRGQTVMVRVVQCQHEDLRQRLAWDPGIAGLSSSLTDRGEWTMVGESYSNFPLIFSVERSASVAGASQRSCITSVGHQHVQLMEAMWILVEIWRMDSFRDEAMGQVQEVQRIDIFQDCSSQSIAVHFLIWDPGGGVCYCSSLDGFHYVSHRWTWDPGILLGGIWVLLEDKQFSSREDCNVPTLGHHHRAETYDDQSSQMDVIASTGVFERHCGVQLAFIIIFHHYDPFRTGWLWFRSIPTISMILTILSYKLIKITEEGIWGTLLGGTSQCNSSLESGGAALQDGMARSDFQWPGKPQGEIRRFSEVKRLIN
jgi:hypothetical protein